MTLQKSAASWFEIPAVDFERAVGFYEKILDARLTRENMGPMTLAIFPHEEPGGGGAVLKAEGYQPSAQGTVVYLNVADVRPVLAGVEKAGGAVLRPLTELPKGMGVFATVQDTFNGSFLVDVEQKGKPSKWIILNALRALRDYDVLTAVG